MQLENPLTDPLDSFLDGEYSLMNHLNSVGIHSIPYKDISNTVRDSNNPVYPPLILQFTKRIALKRKVNPS